MVRIIPYAIVQPGAGGIVMRAPLVQASESFTAADTTLITALALPWTKNTAGSNNTAAPSIDSGRAHNENAATTSLYYRDDVQPASADYDVEADVVQRSDTNVSSAGVSARIVPGANTHYTALYNNATNGWQLVRLVTGALTQLGSDAAQVLTLDQTYRLRLSVRGTVIALWVDGVPLITQPDAQVTAPGRAGLRTSNVATSTTGIHLDNWLVRQ
jgi:hypothetical protein